MAPRRRRRRQRLAPAEVGERRVGLALPPAGGVPLRLAVAHEQDPGGHPGDAYVPD